MISDILVSEAPVSSTSSVSIKIAATVVLGVLSYSSGLSEATLGTVTTSSVSEFSYTDLTSSASIGAEAVSTLGLLEFQENLSDVTLGSVTLVQNSEFDFYGNLCSSQVGASFSTNVSAGIFNYSFTDAVDFSVGVVATSSFEEVLFAASESVPTLGLVVESEVTSIEFRGFLVDSDTGASFSTNVSAGIFNYSFTDAVDFESGLAVTLEVEEIAFTSLETLPTLGLVDESVSTSIEFEGLFAESTAGESFTATVPVGTEFDFVSNFSESSFGSEFTAQETSLELESVSTEVALGFSSEISVSVAEFIPLNASANLGISTEISSSTFVLNGRVAIAYLDVIMFPTEDFRLEHVSGDYYSFKSV